MKGKSELHVLYKKQPNIKMEFYGENITNEQNKHYLSSRHLRNPWTQLIELYKYSVEPI